MAIFTTKITRSTFTLSPFTSEQMAEIGTVMLDTKKERISRGIGSNDQPAKPLVERYARRKIQRGRAPIRDWFWRGLTMGSLKVKQASENRVTIGPVNTQADQIMTAQRRMSEMWSDSDKDREALGAIVRYQLQHSSVSVIRRVRSGVETVSAWQRMA
jgi:hypothetical protein